MEFLLYILFFMIGSVVGSYTNMLAYRYVNVQSIWGKSRSYCPNCKHTLKWYNLIPVFSYLFQKGKCTFCKEPIHSRYFYLELFSGLLFVLLMHNIPVSYENLIFIFVLLMFLVPILIIDVMIHLIYDGYMKFLMLITAVFLYINQYVYPVDLFIELPTFKQGLIGFVCIYIGFIIINKVGGFALYGDYRFDLFGMGDVKLIAWMYMILGTYINILLMLFLSAVIGILLFASVSLVFYYVNVKKRGTDVEFTLKDVVTKKKHDVKVKLSPVVNKRVYRSFVEDKVLPHTFLVGDIDEKKSIIKLQSGRLSISMKVDKDTINKMLEDKKKFYGESMILDFYIDSNFIFDENGKLKEFEYVKPSDYELYMQSILRTKSFASEGIPFAPSLVFGFLIFLMWGNQIVPFVQSWFLR